MADIKKLEDLSTEDLDLFRARMSVMAAKLEKDLRKLRDKINVCAHRREMLDAARAALEELLEHAMALLSHAEQQLPTDPAAVGYCQSLAAKYTLALDALPTVSNRIPSRTDLVKWELKHTVMDHNRRSCLAEAEKAARLLREKG